MIIALLLCFMCILVQFVNVTNDKENKLRTKRVEATNAMQSNSMHINEAHNTQYDILTLKFIGMENRRSWKCLDKDGYNTRRERVWIILHQVCSMLNCVIKSFCITETAFIKKILTISHSFFNITEMKVLRPGLLIERKVLAVEELKHIIYETYQSHQ